MKPTHLDLIRIAVLVSVTAAALTIAHQPWADQPIGTPRPSPCAPIKETP